MHLLKKINGSIYISIHEFARMFSKLFITEEKRKQEGMIRPPVCLSRGTLLYYGYILLNER